MEKCTRVVLVSLALMVRIAWCTLKIKAAITVQKKRLAAMLIILFSSQATGEYLIPLTSSSVVLTGDVRVDMV
jgi:hypothetical protein